LFGKPFGVFWCISDFVAILKFLPPNHENTKYHKSNLLQINIML